MTSLTSALPVAASILEGIDLERAWETVRTVLRNPGINPTVALFVYAGLALIGLIIVLAALMVLTPSKRRVVKIRRRIGWVPEDADAETIVPVAPAAIETEKPGRKPPGRLFMALTSPLAIGLMVAIAVIGTYAATSTDTYCAETCHGASTASSSARETEHTACRACHEQGLLTGAVGNSASRLRMVVAQTGGARATEVQGAVVDSAACLRCHRAVRSGVIETTRGIKISHAEILSAGQPCVHCHAAAGHSKRTYSASMSRCVVCHDDKQASATCSTCHMQDPVSPTFPSTESTATLGSGKIVYPAVRAANRDCGGCHDQEKDCDGCHGIRMPHSKAFIEGEHARPAAFEAKLACFRCHDPVECGGCHSSFNPSNGVSSHGPRWKQEHKAASRQAGCLCHEQRSRRTEPICTRCH